MTPLRSTRPPPLLPTRPTAGTSGRPLPPARPPRRPLPPQPRPPRPLPQPPRSQLPGSGRTAPCSLRPPPSHSRLWPPLWLPRARATTSPCTRPPWTPTLPFRESACASSPSAAPPPCPTPSPGRCARSPRRTPAPSPPPRRSTGTHPPHRPRRWRPSWPRHCPRRGWCSPTGRSPPSALSRPIRQDLATYRPSESVRAGAPPPRPAVAGASRCRRAPRKRRPSAQATAPAGPAPLSAEPG
mmetsp:Transcript_4508/g.19152  ORF Transcript_4508/g.19152 Transcript_4508/m.19152 type:complete len:241 (+) Transcript_4508:287-1009(+)